MKKLFVMLVMLTMVMGIKAQQTISAQEMSDRIQIRALVDRYAHESDQFKQENYSEIFAKDLKLRIHVGDNVNEINGVDNMINIYKAAGAADVSFTRQVSRPLSLPTAPMPAAGFTSPL